MTVTEAPEQAPTSMSNRQILQAMSGLMVGMFVAILASTVVANALPRIIADLGASQSSYTWVVTAELLAMTATVPLWGKLSDLYNKKLLIQLSLGLFVAGSLLAGFSQGVELLIFSRVVQGIGAGGLTALAQVVMAAIIPPRRAGQVLRHLRRGLRHRHRRRDRSSAALLVDTSWLGWRWCFFIGVPFALAAILLLQRTLKMPTTRREVKIDFLGAFLIVAGVCALLVWTTLAGNQFDWASWQTGALVGVGVVLLVTAVFVESRVPEPIIPLKIFRNRTVALTTIASLFVGVAMFGGTVFLSQYFQISLGKSPTVAGLMSLPMIFGLLVSSTIAGQIISATGRWKVYLVAGGVIMTAGMLPAGHDRLRHRLRAAQRLHGSPRHRHRHADAEPGARGAERRAGGAVGRGHLRAVVLPQHGRHDRHERAGGGPREPRGERDRQERGTRARVRRAAPGAEPGRSARTGSGDRAARLWRGHRRPLPGRPLRSPLSRCSR